MQDITVLLPPVYGLAVAKQTLLSCIFFVVLKRWITVPAAPERRCRENLVESREEKHL